MRSWIGALAALSAAACGQGSSSGAYVLVDREAREAGYALEVQPAAYRGAPILPISAGERDEVTLVHDGERARVPVLPGELAFVHGAGGAISYHGFGPGVPDDRLVVEGARASAQALAETIGAKLEEQSRDRFVLVARDVFELTSFLEPPAGIGGAMPAIERAEPAAIFVEDGAGAIASAELPAFVGFYTASETSILINAAGRFELSAPCKDPMRGSVTLEAGALRFIPEDGSGSFVLVPGRDLQELSMEGGER